MSHIIWPFYFLTLIISEKFHIDPENLTPWVVWGQGVKLSRNNPSHELVSSLKNKNNFFNTVLWISSFWRKGIKVHLALIIRQSNVSPPIVQSGLIVSLLTLEDMLEVCDLSFFTFLHPYFSPVIFSVLPFSRLFWHYHSGPVH